MGKIRTYRATEIEAIRLNAFADVCNRLFAENDMDMTIVVKDIYFDYGQDWMYTAPITVDNRETSYSWQTLCPRDYEIIIGCDSISDMCRYADYYVNEMVDGNVCVNLSKIA